MEKMLQSCSSINAKATGVMLGSSVVGIREGLLMKFESSQAILGFFVKLGIRRGKTQALIRNLTKLDQVEHKWRHSILLTQCV